MADETWIDPEGSHSLFNEIEAIADDIGDAVKRVRNIRTSLPEPWGTDEIGRNFAANKASGDETTLLNVEHGITFLDAVSDVGHSNVNVLVDQDIANSTSLK